MIKRAGKIGRINIKANKKLKQVYWEKGITQCEAKMEGCMKSFGLSFHHRHKRVFYRDKPELLSSFSQTILVCAHCHAKLEKDKALSKKVFEKLRGLEK